jgi:hypothetical protein
MMVPVILRDHGAEVASYRLFMGCFCREVIDIRKKDIHNSVSLVLPYRLGRWNFSLHLVRVLLCPTI